MLAKSLIGSIKNKIIKKNSSKTIVFQLNSKADNGMLFTIE